MKRKGIEFDAEALVGSVEAFAAHVQGKKKLTLRTEMKGSAGADRGDSEADWMEVIHRRSREIDQGKVSCRPREEVVQDIRKKLHARRRSSGGG